MGRVFRRASDPDRLAGDAARDRGEWGAAASHYDRYLKRRPGHFAVRLRLGNMLKEAGELDRARVILDGALEMRADDPAALRARGEFEMFRGEPEAALPFFAAAWRTGRDQVAGMALTRPEALVELARVDGGAALLDGGVDGLRDDAIEGWAFDRYRPSRPVEVVLTINGEERARSRADRPRPELAALGLAPAASGFRLAFDGLLSLPADARVEISIAGAQESLAGCPVDMTGTAGLRRWLGRTLAPPGEPADEPVISILLPIHDVRLDWFQEAVASVLRQTDGRWELVCVDDGSSDARLRRMIETHAATDERIRLLHNASSQGVAAATNIALRSAKAAHVLFLDHDDRLEPEAVERLALATEGADLVYGDEVLTGQDAAHIRTLIARPAFSWWYYLSHPYFVHPVAVRRDLALEVGGMDETFAISADIDFILRILERARCVTHVPGVLYRWRTHPNSTGHRNASATMEATAAAITAHLKRLGRDIGVSPGPVFNTYRLNPADPGGRVRVIIPTRNRGDLLAACVDSLRATIRSPFDLTIIDHESEDRATTVYLGELRNGARVRTYSGAFNYSRMNNEAVWAEPASDEFLLFLNNDIEAIEAGWLERMRALASQPDVGAVGATLLYPDGRIQHAGVVVGLGGYAEHAHKFEPFERHGRRNPGYNCSLTAVREWSAVTGACLMMRREIFDAVGGFDEDLPVGFNDTDLCLRVRALGLSVLNDGYSVLRHHESATRRPAGEVRHPADAARFAERWRSLLSSGDPYYNPMLSLDRSFEPDVIDQPHPSFRRVYRGPVTTETVAGG